MKTGFIHSVESLGALDGPGIRTVVFMQGCPLKCKFCHNIDCSVKKQGTEITAAELAARILKNKEYWGEEGGVTFSGGEPTYQADFVIEVIRLLKKEIPGIHIAIDTCISTPKRNLEKLLEHIDYWMVSIKHMDPEKHKKLTSVSNRRILENIKILDQALSEKLEEVEALENPTQKAQKEILRIRFLVIPGKTDSKKNLDQLGSFVAALKTPNKLELLKYGTHAKHKWIEIYGKYYLEDVPEAVDKDLAAAEKILAKYNLEIL